MLDLCVRWLCVGTCFGWACIGNECDMNDVLLSAVNYCSGNGCL